MELLFNNYFVHLLEVIRSRVDGETINEKELEHCYLKYHKYVSTGRTSEYFTHLINRFNVHIKLIAEQDEFMFASEYHNGSLKLISGLDFITIWNVADESCSSKFKKEIWASLTNLYISAALSLGQTEAENPWPRRIIRNIQLQKQLDKEMENEEDSENSEENAFGGALPDISQIENFFNADNPLANVLNDMKDDLHPEKFMATLNPQGSQNPMEVLSNLFSADNQEGLQKIVTTLGAKFDEKMKARGYSEDDLKEAATDMQSKMANVPGLEMLNNLFTTDQGSVQTGQEQVTQASPNGFNEMLQNDPRFAQQMQDMKAGFEQMMQNLATQNQGGRQDDP